MGRLPHLRTYVGGRAASPPPALGTATLISKDLPFWGLGIRGKTEAQRKAETRLGPPSKERSLGL